MKTLRLFGLTLMAILLSVNFSSCSKDDEPSENQELPIEEKNIVGTWECIESYFSTSDNKEEKRTDDYVEAIFIFNADGTGDMDGTPVKWSLKNNELHCTIEGILPFEYTIKELSKTNMTIINKITEEDSDYWEQERIVLKKK